jgi:hypothetical protein
MGKDREIIKRVEVEIIIQVGWLNLNDNNLTKGFTL